ncbi:hypothetical protein GIB67_029545 [Kingdonia uniflora]|uniref:Aldehyde dehydrogenase domain-containing protein n=1 Tax=Kingdonia uniflora TaxID=39325 RepID=A0A7J7NY77_9MAGN|nr:hypothetical protein GIB67_029545 [Kingdonia uniflora]
MWCLDLDKLLTHPIASHMVMDKLAFIGSTLTGNTILELATRSNFNPVTLEVGGKSPFIICEDVDVDEAAELTHNAMFSNQERAQNLSVLPNGKGIKLSILKEAKNQFAVKEAVCLN